MLTAMPPRFRPFSASSVTADVALRAEQFLTSTSTPVCRRALPIQSAMGRSAKASVSICRGASALSCVMTFGIASEIRRMRVAPIPSARSVVPTPSVPVMPLMATVLPATDLARSQGGK